ncbi:hypothetical protein AQUCO_05700093v1 [Aquilegia coerulea]|uniref:Protein DETOXIFICATION n=1 Tax=Aquilegia coerulea TaxID=218851 RepID=A0A2G5CFZ8_AQUCA|nr:hypothetical protein AQUCO_05700093v1 [Aquilegia coerulea]
MASTTSAPLLEISGYGEEEEKKKGGFWNKVLDVEEAKTQVMFSVPMILTNLSYYCITLVSVMFAGHLGELELASATLANSWAMVTGFALMTGLSGALETFCGQAYGAKSYRMLGIYLQSSVITTIFFSIIVSFIWFYSEPILLLLQQQPQVAKMTTVYMRHLIPGIFAYAVLQCLLRFLQTQTVVIPLVICAIVPLIIEFGLSYVLVYYTVLGFKGAALSAALCLWISVIMLGLYVNYSEKFKYTWEGLSMECFQHVLPGMKLAIPSALMVCLEYWAFELLVLLAGLMPNSETSTSLIAMCVNTQAMSFMITYGFSAAVSTRVSNELGAGNGDRAKNAVAVTLKLSIFLALVFVLSLLFGHNIWASAFSNSPTIKKEFASITPFLAISVFFDSAQGVLSGVSRGCGWQDLAAWTNLIAFYVIGMPIAILVAFKAHLYARVSFYYLKFFCFPFSYFLGD